MHTLVIYAVRAPEFKVPDKEVDAYFEYETADQAELRALLWLLYCPNDIVMYVEIDRSTCKHCDRPIKENVGWVMHRWIHDETGAYTCSNMLTKAEPKEGE